MPTNSQPSPMNSPAFEFKSGMVTIPVLNLLSTDVAVITQQLNEKIKQAPEFFTNSSLLIDLQQIAKQDLDLVLLVKAIRNAGMLPIGIRGGTDKHRQAANDLMLSQLSVHSTNNPISKTQKENKLSPATESNVPPPVSTETSVMTQPIRSGQRVYAKGDLVIIAQVSAGAEIMAEGNIHVYGSLRGRALAGVQGNENARIFCSDLQAELISIAGNYRVSEHIVDAKRKNPVQIYLQKQAIIIQSI